MLCFEDGKIKDITFAALFDTSSGVRRAGIATHDEFLNADADPELKQRILEGFKLDALTKFECHDTFDLVHISMPRQLARPDNAQTLSVYMSKNLLFAVYAPWDSHDNMTETLNAALLKSPSPGRVLVSLLDAFTREDSRVLQAIEDDITEMESELMTDYDEDYIKDIIDLRRNLLALKRHYEQLVDLFDEMEENENDFLSESEMKYCGNIYNRADRLYHNVLNLRDYVTQVREAYQSQVDISLNAIMKVFTVLTAIFLPLTLIVGWYGMNLQMPEFNWAYGYPAVIGLCVVVVVTCIVFFKKNKWF